MNRVIFTLICILNLIAGLSGQSSDFWVKTKGPSGGDLEITKTNSGILYGRYSFPLNTFYRSSDNGNTWSLLQSTLDDFPPDQYRSYLSIGQSGKFYLATAFNFVTNNDLYVSDNEGADWQLVYEDLPFNVIHETGSGALVALKDSTIWRSVDGGFSWETVFTYAYPTNGAFLKFLQNGDMTLSHPYTDITFRTQDDGQTWQPVNKPAGASLFELHVSNTGALFLMSNFKLCRSADNGANWSLISLANLPYPFLGITSMYTLPSGRFLGADNSTEQLCYSDDDGFTWQMLPTAYDIKNLKTTPPLADGTIFGVSQQSVYRSGDGGINWAFAATGVDHANIEQVQFVSQDTFFASTTDGLWRTKDGGENWEKLTEHKRHYDLSPHYRKPLAVHHQSLLTIENWAALWSEDGGATFNTVTPPGGLYNWFAKISPDGSALFLNGASGMCRSTNEGNSWATVINSKYFRDMAFHPSGRYYAVMVTGAFGTPSLWFSDNAGANWQQINPAGPTGKVENVFISSIGQIFLRVKVPFGGLLLRSDDNGVSWDSQPIPNYTSSEPGAKFVDNSAGHIMGIQQPYNTVQRSIDQGISWNNLPLVEDFVSDLSSTSVSTAEISPGQLLYLGIFGNGLVKTGKSTSEGAYLSGTVLSDADADCSTPDAQIPRRDWNVRVEGTSTWYATTDTLGRYQMFIDTGNYVVTVNPPQNLWWSVCNNDQVVMLNTLLSSDTANFEVIATSACPLMTVDVAVPTLRQCFNSNLSVYYCNQGNEVAYSAWVDVTLDPYLSFVNSVQPHTNLGNNVYRFYIGDIANGACDQFSLTAFLDCDSTVLGQTHCILAHAFPDTLCTTVPNWSGAVIEAMVECQDSLIQLKLHNAGNAPSQTLDYIIIEDDVVLMSGDKQYDINETLTIDQPANGHTWRIESQQEPGHPFATNNHIALAFAEGCGGYESLGFINQFTVDQFTPSWDQDCVENTGSYDPNDKQGFPLGTGAEHRIRPGQELEYMIRFQNTGTDTAFNIVVRDTLSAWLDPASVRPGAASHPYTWDLSGQGVLSFTFANILLPDSNTSLAGSQGFVAFKIDQQPGVPLGTQILNTAAIYFDFNLPVITNQTLHTVGEDYLMATQAPQSVPNTNLLTVSPNPVQDEAVFQLKSGAFNRHRIEVSDAYGQVLRSVEISGKQYLFQRKGLPPGAYFFRVTDAAGKPVDAGKLLLH